MGNLISKLALIVAAALWALPAAAETMTVWDQAKQRFVTYDKELLQQVSAKAGVLRNYSAIKRQKISYDGPHKPNTIIVDTSERRLYYVLEGGKAWKYGVGVGRQGFQWTGRNRVSRKAEWPGWTPPKSMIAREAKRGVKLPAYMEGGIKNPLGARALYIGSTLYRIHGSNQPWTIGRAVSSGCIRMVNDDVIHLYNQVNVGTRVVVTN
ncbi:MAG: L,D-transpeptidase [Alphaproteobacteria bacterium]